MQHCEAQEREKAKNFFPFPNADEILFSYSY